MLVVAGVHGSLQSHHVLQFHLSVQGVPPSLHLGQTIVQVQNVPPGCVAVVIVIVVEILRFMMIPIISQLVIFVSRGGVVVDGKLHYV